jgi:hypothetical protein
MAERVYARLPSDLLRELLSDLCQPAAGKRQENGEKGGEDENPETGKPLILVPGTGIEPVTRGFSVPCSTN